MNFPGLPLLVMVALSATTIPAFARDKPYHRLIVLTDISSLTAYGFSLSATCPYRIGYYTILYGGLGGRMEGIQVNSATLPSQYGVSYGNNSFFFTAGGRLHFGSYGLDLRVSDDVMANYTGYLTVKLGLNYEYDTN